jgi:hypothetical protein
MGKALSRKKVARAARVGGGPGRGRAWMWPVLLTFVVVAGVGLIVASRGETARDGDQAPRLNVDHWHQAFGVFVCGSFEPPTPEFHNREGIHSHGDGLIHTHPHSSAATGDRATLGLYLRDTGVKVSADSLEVPGRDKLENGDECPDGQPGKVQLVVRQLGETTGTVVEGNPKDFRLQENQVITLAFAPEGFEVPAPPSVANLLAPSDVPGGQQPQVSIPPDVGGSGGAAPGDTTPPAAPPPTETTTP